MNIHHTTSQTAAARSGGRYLTDVLNKQQPVLVLASGGSALCMLDYVSVNAGKVTLGVLDERFSVAPTHRNSEALLQTPFGRQVRQFGEILHTNQDTFRSVEAFAARLGQRVRDWRDAHPDGVIICTQGVGGDGHTAGMLPMPQDADRFTELFESDTWFVGYDTEGAGRFQYRVTATATFLRNMVDAVAVFMVGASKRQAFNRLQSGDASLHEVPANIVHQIKNVHLFTDL